MNQANTDLISPRQVADTSPQYFNMGMMRRQQNLAESDFALKANKEEAAAQLQNSRLAAAKRVFANGITEEAIGQYGAETGDVETAQKMLGQLKMQQELQGLKDTHGTVLLNHAKLQDEIVKHANDERAQIFGDIDLNDTSAENMGRINARWQYLRSVNQHLADYDEKNNLIRGGELPEQPDLNMIAAIKSRGTTIPQQGAAKQNEEMNKNREMTLSETRRHNKAMESKQPDRSNMSEWEGIDPTTGKPYTEAVGKAAKNAIAMERSINVIDGLTSKGFNEGSVVSQVMTQFSRKKKLSFTEFMNLARTPEEQMYLQASLEFMEPRLRDVSGAVINADEYVAEAKRFFPVVNDKPGMIKQKKKARRQEFISRKVLGGNAYKQIKAEIERDEVAQNPDESKLLDDLFGPEK